MIELIIATLIFIQSPQDLLENCGHVDLTPTQIRHGCMRWSDNTIHILGDIPMDEQYKTLFHEQAHNLFYTYDMPTIFIGGEEHRANEFAWWMYEKKYAKPNTYILQGSDEDRYFKVVCDSECVRVLLDIKLASDNSVVVK